MHPNRQEIEEVGDAFLALGYMTFTPKEQDYLSRFLNQYAKEYNDAEVKALYKDKDNVIQAFKTLNNFAKEYQNEKEVIQEFNEEIYDLLINLNRKNEGIMI